MEYFLIIFLITVLVLCILLILNNIKKDKRLKRITEQTEKFLQGQNPITPELNDSTISHLETAIAELQRSVLSEKEFSKVQAKNNTLFLSDISHQLKTPLAGLKLYCEMDASESESLHTEKQLELINKMEELINRVIKLEKLRSDTYQMNFSENELNGIFTELKNEFLHIFPEKNIEINGTAVFRCDREWIKECFGNIIKNSCEHTSPDGKITVRIYSESNNVSISVEDNGGGVKPDELPKLFIRFHRTENAAPSSTGIGLAVTKAIVDKHHGTIEAENTASGLKITAYFPVVDAGIKL